MYLLDVIPIVKGLSRDTLTYYSSRACPVGALISIPLRKKNVLALVVKTKDLRKSKMDVRTSAFNIKKAGESRGILPLSENFLKAAELVSLYHRLSLSQTM